MFRSSASTNGDAIKGKIKMRKWLWMIIIWLFIFICAILLLKSCKSAEIIGEPVEHGKLADGVFQGSFKHIFNQAEVKVTIEKERITQIDILKHDEWKGEKAEVSELYSRLNDTFGDSVNLILADSRTCIYIVSKYATKGNAIQKLISLYDIKPEEVAVFGDDTPDIGMFGIFGHSIAMGNAHESLKAASSYVTLTNDEDGVVYALRTHLGIL